jgi:hypothetical protein
MDTQIELEQVPPQQSASVAQAPQNEPPFGSATHPLPPSHSWHELHTSLGSRQVESKKTEGRDAAGTESATDTRKARAPISLKPAESVTFLQRRGAT